MRLSLVPIIVATAILLPDCHPCESVMPIVTSMNTDAQDAEIAIDQAEAVFESMPLSPEQRAEAMSLVNTARDVLRSCEALISAATSACSKPDPLAIFSDFVGAWQAIAGLLGQHSLKGSPYRETAALVKTPKVVTQYLQASGASR